MSNPGKCPNCAATLRDLSAEACEYCGNAIPQPPKKFKTPEEELGYEINGLAFSSVVVLLIVGIIWQCGLSRIALLLACGWFLLLAGYSIYLYRRFGKK